MVGVSPDSVLPSSNRTIHSTRTVPYLLGRKQLWLGGELQSRPLGRIPLWSYRNGLSHQREGGPRSYIHSAEPSGSARKTPPHPRGQPGTSRRVKKKGYSIASPLLNTTVGLILKTLEQKDCSFVTSYIRSADNDEADTLSREQDRNDWMLHPNHFRSITRQWGTPSVDLFASRLNHQVPRWFSWRHQPGTGGVDALLQDWSKETLLYANPPWPLIPQVLLKFQRECRKTKVIIVLPLWKTKSWWPLLKELAVNQLSLPRSPNLSFPRTQETVTEWVFPAGRPVHFSYNKTKGLYPVSVSHQIPSSSPNLLEILSRLVCFPSSGCPTTTICRPLSQGTRTKPELCFRYFKGLSFCN